MPTRDDIQRVIEEVKITWRDDDGVQHINIIPSPGFMLYRTYRTEQRVGTVKDVDDLTHHDITWVIRKELSRGREELPSHSKGINNPPT